MADEKKKRKKERKRKHSEVDDVEIAKHIETFYEQAPPVTIEEETERPEECIPDLPENQEAREFLAHAPSKGLWMPLGKEVKVMKCWRCKVYGHRTGDRECPMFVSGNKKIEKFRVAHEDPMHDIIKENKKAESDSRIAQLKALLQESTTSDSDSGDESHHHKKKRKHKHKHKSDNKSRERKSGKKKKKHKHRKSHENSSESDKEYSKRKSYKHRR